jgi:hypothetical protein
MAIPIKPPPVLVGRAAQEFYEKVANAKCSQSKEEVQENYRTWKAFFEEQNRINPSNAW